MKKYSNNASGRGITMLMAAIIVVVLGMGIYAVHGTISKSLSTNRLASGDATIAERADQYAMSADDFITYYGLSNSGLKGSDKEEKAIEAMTLGNFMKFYGASTFDDSTLAEYKTAAGLADDITLDSTDMTAKSQCASYYQQKKQEEQAAQQAAQQAQTATGDSAATGDATAADTTVDQTVTSDVAAE